MMIPPPYLDVIDRIWTCRHANEDYQVSNISELYTDTQTQTHNISSSNLKSLLKSSVNVFVIWADWDVNLYNHSIPPFCSKSASRRGHPQKWPFCYTLLSAPMSLSSLLFIMHVLFQLGPKCCACKAHKLCKTSHQGTIQDLKELLSYLKRALCITLPMCIAKHLQIECRDWG